MIYSFLSSSLYCCVAKLAGYNTFQLERVKGFSETQAPPTVCLQKTTWRETEMATFINYR